MQRSIENKQGFTLIETLVSILSFTIFFTALVVVMQVTYQLVIDSRTRIEAIALGNEIMEGYRNLPYEDIGTVGGIPNGVIEEYQQVERSGQNYSVHTTVVYIDDDFDQVAPTDTVPIDYKRLTVAITWEGVQPSKSPVFLVSDSAPDGIETSEGGGTLILEVVDASGLPVSGASIAIVNDDVVPQINLNALTDSTGRLVLPGSPECVGECYEIGVSKSGYSGDRTYSTVEVVNPDRPHATVLEGEVTSLVFQIDRTSSISIFTTGSRELGYPTFMGVQMTLRGSKIIGTDASDQPVYKYNNSGIVSGTGGYINIPNLEWDTYTLTMPTGSSVDIAGTNPNNPFGLLPNQGLTLRVVTNAATANTWLAAAKDLNGVLIEDATMTLFDLDEVVATKSSGLVGTGDQGQAFFPGLSPGLYTLLIEKTGFKSASSSATISGDFVSTVVMEAE